MVNIFGICSDLGSPRYGSAKGVELLLPFGKKVLGRYSVDYLCGGHHTGERDPADQVIGSHHALQLKEVEDYVKGIILAGDKPLMVGGDHSFTYSVLKALLTSLPDPSITF